MPLWTKPVSQSPPMTELIDPTEEIRRKCLVVINSAVESQDVMAERKRLESRYGKVWDATQLSEDFEVVGFMAPYVVVRRKSDGSKGSLHFQHHPRFYFNFVLD